MQSLELSFIRKLLEKDSGGKAVSLIPPTFVNKTAAFYLNSANYDNLFEAADALELDPYKFRCKGCATIVLRPKREEHFNLHKREINGT